MLKLMMGHRARRALLTLVLVTTAGCATSPRDDADTRKAVADSLGLDQAIEFNVVGPDGGPLDEPVVTDGDRLTLALAVASAVRSDPELQAALARVHIALADADQARLLPNPVLNFIVRWGPGSTQIEASLTQDLIDILKIPRRASAADHRLQQASAEAVEVALDVVVAVQERYVTAQALDALLPLLEERRAILAQLESAARARFEAGEATRADLVMMQGQRVGLEVEIDRTALEARQERLKLARLIGEPSSPALWMLEAWAPPAFDVDESQCIAVALRRRPESQSVVWKLAALGDDRALAALSLWDGTGLGVDAQKEDGWTVGPSISTPIPLFDMGQARDARVEAEELEARHELTLVRRRIVEDVRVALFALQASQKNLTRARDEFLPLQKRRRDLAEDVFRAQESDSTALALAEQDLRAAQVLTIDLERQIAIASIRLTRALGGAGAQGREISP